MALVLRTYIISRERLALLEAIAMELILLDWSYRATYCMGRQGMAAVRAMAQCLPSILIARALRPCTILRVAVMERIRTVWFYRATPYTAPRIAEGLATAPRSAFRSS